MNTIYTVVKGAKKLILASVLLVAALSINAQNEPIIAHFMYHTHVFNPAVSGNTRDIYLGAMARQQWVGYKEAPSTQLLDAYGYISKIRGGVGLVIVNDMLGKQRNTSARISYAYSQRINEKTRISLGLAVGLLNTGLRGSELVYQQDNDQSGIFTNQNRFKAYLNLGLELYAYGFTAGFSVSNLEQSLNKATVFKLPRHYFGYVKYDWNINEKVSLNPGVFVRSSGFATQAEINLNATFKKRITAGIFYRTVDAAGVLLGVHATKHLFISYAYDFDFGKMSQYQTGSHELNLIYRFDGMKEKKTFYKSSRYTN